MSMYGAVFGDSPLGQVLVGYLKSIQDFKEGRYRDAWVEAHGDACIIAMYTRNGGGNREDYDDPSISAHPWYQYDADDDFDCTYATYYFQVPIHEIDQGIARGLIAHAQAPVDTSQKWLDAIDAIGGK